MSEVPTIPVSASPHEPTVADPVSEQPAAAEGQECCLVQIYPVNTFDGMISLGEDAVLIGREAGCNVRLPDTSVSRQHAQIGRTENGFAIEDLESTNGTQVNGQPIKRHELVTGDSIKIGTFWFKYLAANSVEVAYHETIYNALTVDALTGAFNKNYLLDNFQREIARCTRHGRPLAVVMADIDNFKTVNDTHGHLVGDEILRLFGQRLLSSLREGDLFARYGGEEFCLLMPDSGVSEALLVAERCREVIADEPFDTTVGPLEITASFGVDVYAGDQPATPKSLIGVADQLLYAAKQAGRNRVVGPDEHPLGEAPAAGR